MRRLRRHIVWLTMGWLLCQAAAISATQVVVCSACLAEEAELPACCRNLEPGQTCPMHSHAETGGQACHMRSACPTHDASLLALAAGLAAPPATRPVLAVVRRLRSIAVVEATTTLRASRPDSPPPRS